MTDDSWEEVHENEMGIGGICNRQYEYMTATNCLDNLNGTLGTGGDHSYIRGAISQRTPSRQRS